MNDKGIQFTFEAVVSLCLLVLIILALNGSRAGGGTELEGIETVKKQHNLITVWLVERNFSHENLKNDFIFVFPGKSGRIVLGEQRIDVGEVDEDASAITSVGFVVRDDLEVEMLTVSVLD